MNTHARRFELANLVKMTARFTHGSLANICPETCCVAVLPGPVVQFHFRTLVKCEFKYG